MIKEAEAMAEEDKAAREKIEARNNLENYAYQDKKKVTTAVEEAITWLEEAGAEASTEELVDRKKSLEKLVNPIMESVYKQGGGGTGEGKEEDIDTEDL